MTVERKRLRSGALAVLDETALAAAKALQAGRGTERDQEILFRALYRPLYILFANDRRLLAEAAEDLTQEAIFRVFNHLGSCRSEKALWAWAKKIAANLLSNYLRDRDTARRSLRLEVPLEVVISDPDDREALRERAELSVPPEAEAAIEEKERLRQLRAAAAELPPGVARVFWLRLRGLRYQEIADTLGVGLNTVRSQLAEARSRLRRILGRSTPPDGPRGREG